MTAGDVEKLAVGTINGLQENGIEMSDDSAIALFRHFHWNKEKLVDNWFDDSEGLSMKLGLVFDKDSFKELSNE